MGFDDMRWKLKSASGFRLYATSQGEFNLEQKGYKVFMAKHRHSGLNLKKPRTGVWIKRVNLRSDKYSMYATDLTGNVICFGHDPKNTWWVVKQHANGTPLEKTPLGVKMLVGKQGKYVLLNKTDYLLGRVR
jgi:hypothetical protein